MDDFPRQIEHPENGESLVDSDYKIDSRYHSLSYFHVRILFNKDNTDTDTDYIWVRHLNWNYNGSLWLLVSLLEILLETECLPVLPFCSHPRKAGKASVVNIDHGKKYDHNLCLVALEICFLDSRRQDCHRLTHDTETEFVALDWFQQLLFWVLCCSPSWIYFSLSPKKTKCETSFSHFYWWTESSVHQPYESVGNKSCKHCISRSGPTSVEKCHFRAKKCQQAVPRR